MFKKAVQQGRSKRRGESYSPLYVEPLSAARTTLADFFNILLETPVLKRTRNLAWVQDAFHVDHHTILLATQRLQQI